MYRALKWLLGPLIRLVWRVDVQGLERLPRGAYVVAANHDSILDPFFVAVALPRQVRFVGKQEFWRNPLLAPILRAVGAIPIARGEGDFAALDAATSALEAGSVVGVFPEGTVLHGDTRVWKRGAARLALAAGVPIVPVCLVETGRAFRPVQRRVGFPVVRVLIGEPILVAQAQPTPEAATELIETVESSVRRLREGL
jgi:1-acyl-sn-glycerol-3-phosphate acyltransferase